MLIPLASNTIFGGNPASVTGVDGAAPKNQRQVLTFLSLCDGGSDPTRDPSIEEGPRATAARGIAVIGHFRIGGLK
jgi:hypothetical protein